MTKYKVIATSLGGTVREILNDLSYEEALDFCRAERWVMDRGYIWDLDIEEDDGDDSWNDDLQEAFSEGWADYAGY